MNLEDKLKAKNRVLSGWINDKQFLFNAVPLEDAIAILAESQEMVNVDQRVMPEIAEEELRILFRNNSDCYADTWKTENDGSWHEGKTIQALTEDKFIEIIKKQFSA